MSTCRVTCTQSLKLRLYEMKPNEAGTPTAKAVGDPVLLNEGVNEVDKDFITAWREQNKDFWERGIVTIDEA